MLAIPVKAGPQIQIHTLLIGNNASLIINRRPVVTLDAGYQNLSAAARIKLVQARLRNLGTLGSINTDFLKVTKQGAGSNAIVGLAYRNQLIVLADPLTAAIHHMSCPELANFWRENLKDALEQNRPQYKVKNIINGYASWYGKKFSGRRTANGELFDETEFTAAHRSLPFGTRVRVTNPYRNLAVIVRINDRGPWTSNREIDLSWAAARTIGLKNVARVRLEVLAN